MSNYTKTTDFAAKDSLPTGDSGKIIRGAEFETEFDNIATAIATKADTAGPTFTGTATFASTNTTDVQINSVSVTATAAEINTLDGITSTTAELNTLDGFTGTVDDLNYAKDLRASGVTTDEYDTLSGVTASTAELNILDGATVTTAELNILDGVTSTAAELNILDGVTATAVELNLLDGVTATTAELNILDGVTADATELNYVEGVTSAIQTQIDTKAPTASPTLTGTVTAADLIITNRQVATDDAEGIDVAGNDVTVRGGASTGAGEGGSILLQASPSTTTGNTVNTFTTILEVDEDGIDVTGTVTADGLTVDTDTLHVDATNNRVGIGTTSPAAELHIQSASPEIRFTDNDTVTNVGKITYLDGRLVLQSDDDNQLGSSTIEFQIDGSEAVRIDPDGKVGIGTNSPSDLLDISANGTSAMRLSDSSSPATYAQFTQANGVLTFAADAGGSQSGSVIKFLIDNSEHMRIDSSGNLLVGTTSLLSASETTNTGLRVANTGGTVQVRDGGVVQYINRLTSDGDITAFQKDGTTVGSIGVDNTDNLFIAGNSTHGGLQFGTDSVAPHQNGALAGDTIDLGTSSSRFKDLHLSRVLHVGNGSLSAPSITFGSDTNTGFYRAGTDSIGAVTNASERMRIDSSGNVGIGTSSPDTLMHLSSLTDATLRLESTKTAIATNDVIGAIEWEGNDATTGSSGVVGKIDLIAEDATPDHAMRFFTHDNLSGTYELAERMRITSGGDLHVDGNVIAYSTTISDRRLKSDITNISNALDKVGQINGVTFVRDHNGEKAAGVVAQEIIEVLPEAVKSQALPLQTGEQDQEYYVVEYDAVTGLLVEAVKELKARVEALEAQ
jgi:hypothetical protein